MLGCPLLDLAAWGDPRKPVLSFEFPNYLLAPLVIVALAHVLAIEPDAGSDNVNMVVRGVGVPYCDVLGVLEAHLLGIALSYLPPLIVVQALAWGQGKAYMVDGSVELRPELSALGKFGEKFSCVLSQHVAADDLGAVLTQNVVEAAPEASALGLIGDHSLSPSGSVPAAAPSRAPKT
jgi:hypothetical protein